MTRRTLLAIALALAAFVATSCDDDGPGDLAPVASVPSVRTTTVTDITQTGATAGGDVLSDGGASVTARGICLGTDAGSASADVCDQVGGGVGSFTSSLTGLATGTPYRVRAYATNSAGTGYGGEVFFTTLEADPSTITDVDGNVYRTVRIGSQLWMAENLEVTMYTNGDPIPNVTGNAAWVALGSPAYAWYQNDVVTYGAVYGALYNWFAVDSLSNGNRCLCPTGWHVPTADEWTTLTTYLGGLAVAGGKMKEAGTSHWAAPNTGATNESGFTALAGGFRGYASGGFNFVRNFGHWWSRTPADPTQAWGEGLFYLDNPTDHSPSNKKNGFSIRCVRD